MKLVMNIWRDSFIEFKPFRVSIIHVHFSIFFLPRSLPKCKLRFCIHAKENEKRKSKRKKAFQNLIAMFSFSIKLFSVSETRRRRRRNTSEFQISFLLRSRSLAFLCHVYDCTFYFYFLFFVFIASTENLEPKQNNETILAAIKKHVHDENVLVISFDRNETHKYTHIVTMFVRQKMK